MNKKIKIIDLLNKIANGEEVPSRIQYYQDKYSWYMGKYCKEPLMADGNFALQIYANQLYYEVEILEDNTEEIEELDEEWTYIEGQVEKTWSKSELELVNKINELVRVVNEMKEESEDKQ